MAWTSLPTTEGSFSLNANILANSVGGSLDDMLDEANSLSAALSTAISDIATNFEASIGSLTVSFVPVLDTTTSFTAPTLPTVPSLPDVPTFADAPDAPADATVLSLTLGSAPTVSATPDAPDTDGMLLDATAYTGAFDLGRNNALQSEQLARWRANQGAAASGIGLPLAAQLSANINAEQERKEVVGRIAQEQATLQASHLREDRRFAYTQALAVWQANEQAKVAAYQAEVQKFSEELRKWVEQNGMNLRVSEQGLRHWQTVSQQTIAEFTTEIERLQEDLKNKVTVYQQDMAKQAALLQWRTADNATEMDRAKFATDASIKLQEFAINIAKDGILATAGALAEQFKAWCSQVSFSASTDSSVGNITYAGG